MRELPKVTIPGFRKVYVYRDAVQRLLDEGTVDAVTVRARHRAEAADVERQDRVPS